ncbi:hypothetical protein DENSPDRAFT_329033 [Dentipellis sp. KUC8613]|nr:hypothetical protein DENSPDRAFT_329033 [Dentipellis sp. KUC8613]
METEFLFCSYILRGGSQAGRDNSNVVSMACTIFDVQCPLGSTSHGACESALLRDVLSQLIAASYRLRPRACAGYDGVELLYIIAIGPRRAGFIRHLSNPRGGCIAHPSAGRLTLTCRSADRGGFEEGCIASHGRAAGSRAQDSIADERFSRAPTPHANCL